MRRRSSLVITLAALLASACQPPEADPPAAPEPAPAEATTAEAPPAETPPAEAPTAEAPTAAAPPPTADTPPAPAGIAGVAGVAPTPAPADPDAPTIAAEDFDLAQIHEALSTHAIADGDALERYINDRDNRVTRVDLDRDGEIDLVQIDEVRREDEVAFEIRAVPSRSRRVDDAVTVAVIHVRPERDARRLVVVSEYTAVVIHRPARPYEHIEVVDYDDDGLIVLAPGHRFFLWLFAVERPVYESVVIYTLDRALVRPTRVRVVEVAHCWPPGHCKHRHHRHKHKKRKHKHDKHKHKHKKHKHHD